MNKKIIIGITSAIIIITSLFLWRRNACPSPIIPIDSFAQAADALAQADQKTLILFDVDETLIMPASIAMRSATKEKHKQWLKQTIDTIFNSLPHPQDYYFDNWDMSEQPFMLIEPSIVATIASLQERGITTLGLTLASSGTIGRFIPLYPEFRHNTLHDLGINFDKSNLTNITFTNLTENKGTHPMLYKGILYANLGSKGAVLGAFLDTLSWKPHTVIFFDDSLKRIHEVRNELCKRKIPCICYHYKGAEHVPGELDKNIALLQFNYLAEHEQWLSDDEAQELLTASVASAATPYQATDVKQHQP